MMHRLLFWHAYSVYDLNDRDKNITRRDGCIADYMGIVSDCRNNCEMRIEIWTTRKES